MDDNIYKELQAAVKEIKAETSGIPVAYTNLSIDAYLSDTPGSQILCSDSVINNLKTGALSLLAMLRAQDAMYKQHCRISADRHLYSQMYDTTCTETVDFAQKIAEYLGHIVLDSDIKNQTHDWINKWGAIEDPIKRALVSEMDFQEASNTYYNQLKDASDSMMLLGYDDYIRELHNTHSAHAYILEQKHAFQNSDQGRKVHAKISYDDKHSIRISSMDDLKSYTRVGNDLLIHKCEKDLWKITKDSAGNDVIQKLYTDDILKY